ncbi:MAG: hypothetical protein KJ042_09635 [Deltaproteobacteria bacterium]|nr:hypothetical protein [Deltaproteobacteria bacterium]
MTPHRTIAILLALTALLVAATAHASDADTIAVIEAAIPDALDWLIDEAWHEGEGFYYAGWRDFHAWDTALAIWAFIWLSEHGWDTERHRDEVVDALAWLETRRHPGGEYFYAGVDVPDEGDIEITSFAGQIIPHATTDAWIVGEQRKAGNWYAQTEAFDPRDYPSLTGHAMYMAACRELPIDWSAAYDWLMSRTPEDYLPARYYYYTRFYNTYPLSAVARLRPDFPKTAREGMVQALLAFQDEDGSFEGRTMDDTPSAIVPTSLALQTALELDDPRLTDVIDRAAGFLLDHFEDRHWPGNQFGPNYAKDESLFTTVHAARALGMLHARLTGGNWDTCVRDPDSWVAADDDADDDLDDDADDDDTGDNDDESVEDANDDDDDPACGC